MTVSQTVTLRRTPKGLRRADPSRSTALRMTVMTLLALLAPLAYAANWPEHPVLRAVRVSKPPVVDGDLSDPAWQQAPEFTDFTQHDPDDTKPATLRTSIRIVYDDSAIYFGAKMTDPQRPSSLLYRRDTFGNFDFLSINLDPQHDRLSGNAFTVTPAGEQGDTVLYNDIGEDPSWDGVWESAVKTVPDGWIAEVRIPFSQLRFPDRDHQVWGINITRRIMRLQETVRIVNTPKGSSASYRTLPTSMASTASGAGKRSSSCRTASHDPTFARGSTAATRSCRRRKRRSTEESTSSTRSRRP